MSCLAASLVRTFRYQANERVFTSGLAVGFGLSSLALLASYDPQSCSWKTSQQLFLWEEPLSLEDLPRWGMTHSGCLYALPKWVRPMPANAGSASLGMWATPRSSVTQSDIGTGEIVNGRLHRNGNVYGLSLPAQVALYPTPTASDEFNRQPTNAYVTATGTIRRRNQQGTSSFMRLSEVLKLWGTPTASAYKRSGREGSKSNRFDRDYKHLKGQVVEGTQTAINPEWECLLMGYPANWLNIDSPPTWGSRSTILNRPERCRRQRPTGRIKCVRLVTPSCRR